MAKQLAADSLAVLQYTQDDATFFGLDLQVDATVYDFGANRRLRVSAMASHNRQLCLFAVRAH